MSFYAFAKALCHFFVSVFYRMRYEGLENIPMDRGFIMASNHISVFDPLFLAVRLKPQIHFMAKIELFKNPVFGRVLSWLNAFPVDRGKGDGAAIREAGHRIAGGGVLGMFIEGTRSNDGVPKRARSGVAMIAGETGADVLPCAIVYHKKLQFRGKVTVCYGKLIKNDQLKIDVHTPSTLRIASKSIMADIKELFLKFNEACEGGPA
ncbi:MAG: 1-acyl-sn-glycerol-3-phosphate acyltransferase [Oscillospiraceae bacterium]|nr:1-acyl-sn-glycerol-3-phosphate acyltransferase [Oscillospiraceae bacterium]